MKASWRQTGEDFAALSSDREWAPNLAIVKSSRKPSRKKWRAIMWEEKFIGDEGSRWDDASATEHDTLEEAKVVATALARFKWSVEIKQ